MIRTIQQDNLSGKSVFEIWAVTFWVKINRYYVDNGIFSAQPFISSIEDANQAIIFCEVGYHHQNAMAERKIQTIALRARTLLLHENIYWPEAITTILWTYALNDFS